MNGKYGNNICFIFDEINGENYEMILFSTFKFFNGWYTLSKFNKKMGNLTIGILSRWKNSRV